ncbi:GGDEF domain-containing protein [Aidingimonas lacisalsi]|uniref:GGDEF domain-containing protein n=1 Tax=Aidingimonas lacisalsi TaxID=2604086 RepID=UPI0011D18977|nr:sensor domain-containing diguanylate cyclase [Aidingimonas lacisalsi]
MNALPLNLDAFPCGCLITSGTKTSQQREVAYANTYVHEVFGFPDEALIGKSLASLLTPASVILFDSYMLPMLMNDGYCDEILLEIRAYHGEKVPIVVNTRLYDPQGGRIHWALFNATQRNRLYQELLERRRQLEEKAAQLETLSSQDELTGLLNRRELLKRADMILAQAIRAYQTAGVLLVDIDYFKEINDYLGHAEGDRVLAALGRRFRELGRQADVIARYGGEEFIFVLGNTHQDGICALAERLHAIARDIPIGHSTLTISIGISLSEGAEAPTFDELFRKADRALYLAKSEGRNTTRLYRESAFGYVDKTHV